MQTTQLMFRLVVTLDKRRIDPDTAISRYELNAGSVTGTWGTMWRYQAESRNLLHLQREASVLMQFSGFSLQLYAYDPDDPYKRIVYHIPPGYAINQWMDDDELAYVLRTALRRAGQTGYLPMVPFSVIDDDMVEMIARVLRIAPYRNNQTFRDALAEYLHYYAQATPEFLVHWALPRLKHIPQRFVEATYYLVHPHLDFDGIIMLLEHVDKAWTTADHELPAEAANAWVTLNRIAFGERASEDPAISRHAFQLAASTMVETMRQYGAQHAERGE